jgi:hypothetical protein
VQLPRDVDIRSCAFLLFAFVVVVVFTGFVVVSVVCRVGGGCAASSTGLIETVTGLTENIIAVLLALMAGGRPPPRENGKEN